MEERANTSNNVDSHIVDMNFVNNPLSSASKSESSSEENNGNSQNMNGFYQISIDFLIFLHRNQFTTEIKEKIQ